MHVAWIRYRFELYKDERRCWRWRLIAPNGRVLAQSADGYRRRSDAYQSLQRMRQASSNDRTEVVQAA
jgi:uncharacterized protein YegP (UPF0339 family)